MPAPHTATMPRDQTDGRTGGATAMISEIIKRDGTIVPYDRTRIAEAILKAMHAVDQSDRAQAEALAQRVEEALEQAYGPDAAPSVEDIQDMVEQTLMTQGHTRTARSYIIYRHERAQMRAARTLSFEVSDNIPYKKIYEALLWNMNYGCDSVEGLNRIIHENRFAELVTAADRRYEDEVGRAAAAIMDRDEPIRLIVIAGPSSSGKTTTTLKLRHGLAETGIKLKTINVDNYFFSLEQHPEDEFGDRDYERPQALDLALINRHLAELLEGRTIRTPDYDFKTGKRRLDVHELRLGHDEMLLLDSLHGLFTEMTESVGPAHKFKLYVETLGQLRGPDGTFMRWADNRLLRRMIRDARFRNLGPMETLAHWHYVRRSELQNIIPFISSVDCVVNTALPYELPILKHRLFEYFEPAIKTYAADPLRQDAYIRAKRVSALLGPLQAVADDGCVPGDSLLREFIGGSSYEY